MTVFQPITGTASSIAFSATSRFANPTGAAGSALTLPIDLSIGKNVPTLRVSDLNVTAIRLTYVFTNSDLLHIPNGDIPNAVQNLPAGWAVDPDNSSITGNTLVIMLRGGPLTDGMRTLGEINFLVTLSKDASSTDVQLKSMELLNGTTPVGACAQTAVQGGSFNLILRCGDSTMTSEKLKTRGRQNYPPKLGH